MSVVNYAWYALTVLFSLFRVPLNPAFRSTDIAVLTFLNLFIGDWDPILLSVIEQVASCPCPLRSKNLGRPCATSSHCQEGVGERVRVGRWRGRAARGSERA